MREDRARLALDIGTAPVARGRCRQREQVDAGVAGDTGRLAGGRVLGIGGAVDFVVAERRLVDEQVGAERARTTSLGAVSPG